MSANTFVFCLGGAECRGQLLFGLRRAFSCWFHFYVGAEPGEEQWETLHSHSSPRLAILPCVGLSPTKIKTTVAEEGFMENSSAPPPFEVLVLRYPP